MKASAKIRIALAGAMFTFLSAESVLAACGQFEVAKGDVKILDGKTKQTVAAKVGAKICSGDTVIAAKDSRAKLKMEDGNELNISPESRIMLENYQFDAAQNKKKVLLNVLQGKVRAATKQENMYNDKAKDGSENTFQVKTKSAVAGVRGTDFLTGFDIKTNKSEIVTFKGKVEVGQMGPGGQILNPVQVGAGQKTETVPGQPPAPPKPVPATELQKMNSESRSDTAGANNAGGAPQAAAASDKKEGGADEKKPASENKQAGGDKQQGGEKAPAAGGDKQADNGQGGGQSPGQGDAKRADNNRDGSKSQPGNDGKGGGQANAGGPNGGPNGGPGSGQGGGEGNARRPSGTGPTGGSMTGPAGGPAGDGRAPASVGGSMPPPMNSMIGAGEIGGGDTFRTGPAPLPTMAPIIMPTAPPIAEMPKIPSQVTDAIQIQQQFLKVRVCIAGQACP